jgi:hypothetical protein
MPDAVVLPAGEPLGFPRCARCPYRYTGPPGICVTCAGKTLEAIAPVACAVCSQRLEEGDTCRNWLCADSNRRIDHIDARPLAIRYARTCRDRQDPADG